MKKFGLPKGDPKYGKIGTAKVISRIKILIAGALMSLAVIFHPTDNLVGPIFAIMAAGVFVWDIISQSRSAIDVEKRISELEGKVRKLENPGDSNPTN